jgi:hypothetical protein
MRLVKNTVSSPSQVLPVFPEFTPTQHLDDKAVTKFEKLIKAGNIKPVLPTTSYYNKLTLIAFEVLILMVFSAGFLAGLNDVWFFGSLLALGLFVWVLFSSSTDFNHTGLSPLVLDYANRANVPKLKGLDPSDHIRYLEDSAMLARSEEVKTWVDTGELPHGEHSPSDKVELFQDSNSFPLFTKGYFFHEVRNIVIFKSELNGENLDVGVCDVYTSYWNAVRRKPVKKSREKSHLRPGTIILTKFPHGFKPLTTVISSDSMQDRGSWKNVGKEHRIPDSKVMIASSNINYVNTLLTSNSSIISLLKQVESPFRIVVDESGRVSCVLFHRWASLAEIELILKVFNLLAFEFKNLP